MPFNPTPNAPSTNAKVTITFAGLLLLKPDANNRCEVGVHHFSSSHLFQVILIVNKPQRPPTVIRLLTGPLSGLFEINATPDPGTGVLGFAPTPEPFVRNDPNNNALDFRWSLNGRALHANADFNDGARPVMRLNAGVLYTPNLTLPSIWPELVRGPQRTPLHRLAADLAAAIDLQPRSKIVLSWFELGDPRTLDLPRPADPANTIYTVALVNNPPINTPIAHDELALYYKVLQVNGAPIPPTSRFRLEFNIADPTTDEIPCMPGLLNP